MKGRKRGPTRALAIILSSILMVSSVGLTVFADEQIPAAETAGIYEESVEAGTESPAQEIESQPDDVSSEEDQAIGEVPQVSSADETEDEQATDDDIPDEGVQEETDGDELDEGVQEDPSASADQQPGEEEPEDIVQIEEGAVQSTENEAGESEEQPSGETLGAASDESGITTWWQLRAALKAGGEVKLTQSITAEPDDYALTVPSGVTVTLNLNGHTLKLCDDSGLTEKLVNGNSNYRCAIDIQDWGTLILNGDGTIDGNGSGEDGIHVSSDASLIMNGGTITGVNRFGVYMQGYFTMNGGTILNAGCDGVWVGESFTMNGGLITGSKNYGVRDYREFTMNGGTISGNGDYGVYAYKNDFKFAGGDISDKIYLHEAVIIIDTKLDDTTIFRVNKLNAGVLTHGLSGKGTAANFESATEGWCVMPNDDGEATLVEIDSVIRYIERSWSGDQVVSKERVHSTTPFPKSKSVPGGWYYLNQNVEVDGLVSLGGDTNLILGDGFTLDVEGLYIPQGSTLTIYAQSDGENAGKIISEPDSGAAIGATSDGHPGGTIVIHGGNIEAKGHANCAGIGSNAGNGTTSPITIYGGTITAKGGVNGAGIGGGEDCDGGEITIYGGTVTALGGEDGAGIGGGEDGAGGTITIYGGTIYANDEDCEEDNAGIGGGLNGAGGTITINGGTIICYSRDGAGIGGGDNGAGGDITINGGTITSNKVNQGQGARIGGGCDGAPGTIVINDGNITTTGGSGAGIGGGKGNKSGGSVVINGGIINASGSYGIGSGEDGADVDITLNYTDDTKRSISITASSYGGTVTLAKPFKSGDQPFAAGVANNDDLKGLTLTADYDYPAVIINGVTGSFNDKIKLNFYFDFPNSLISDENARVEIVNSETGKGVTEFIKNAEYIGTKGYRFSIPLAAKEARDTIVARVIDGNKKMVTIIGKETQTDYTNTGVRSSLIEYFDWLEEKAADDKEKAVGAAAKDYCTAAQIYFNYHMTDDGLTVRDAVKEVDPESMSAYIAGREGKLPTGVSIKGISAMLESDNTLRLYLGFKDVNPNGFTYTIDGETAILKQREDGMYYLARPTGTYSNHLQKTHKYSVSDGTNTYTVTASVLTYARTCARKSAEVESNLGKALYLYNKAAVAAFGE